MEKNKMYGAKIRSLRLLRGYSQEYMANELDINQTAYSRIETDKQKLTAATLEKLAQVLGVSAADITYRNTILTFTYNRTKKYL